MKNSNFNIGRLVKLKEPSIDFVCTDHEEKEILEWWEDNKDTVGIVVDFDIEKRLEERICIYFNNSEFMWCSEQEIEGFEYV